jgi:hypothetical protein
MVEKDDGRGPDWEFTLDSDGMPTALEHVHNS